MKYKLIIFDWDGTLINSIDRIVFCLQRTIKKMGFEKRTDVQAQSVIGLGLEEAILTLMPEVKKQTNLLNEAVNTYRDYFFSNNIPDSALFEGAVAVLDYLKNKGYLLAIATGKSLKGLTGDLTSNNVTDYFVVLKTADLTKSKPDPLMVTQIMAELNINKADAVMVGDTTFDLEMANNAGIDSIGLCTGTHSRGKLAKMKPLTILNDVTELPQIL